MLLTPPDETHLAARDALVQMDAPQLVAEKAGRIMEKLSQEYFQLLIVQKSTTQPDSYKQIGQQIDKSRRNLKAISYLLGSTKSTQAYDAHLDLLARADVRDPIVEQLALSMGWIGDPRAVDTILAKLKASADFTEKSLRTMFRNPDIVIILPEDNSAGLMHSAVMMKLSDALPTIMRFSSMGFGDKRPKRSAWVCRHADVVHAGAGR